MLTIRKSSVYRLLERLTRTRDVTVNGSSSSSGVSAHDSRFTTGKDDGKWTGDPGVTLNVTDLQVESPERVTEGDSVRLTCKSSCTLTDRATFIWYRNSQPLTERRDRNNELLLQSVRREDAGRYSCAVHGHNHISPAVQLNVMYPPRNVSISIIQSGQIWSGDSVTLICSSDSNPPALNFSWFKENESSAVGSGQSFSALQSGRFYCQAHNQHGSQRSDAVTVTVHHGAGRNVIVIAASSGGLFFIIIIIIIIIFIIQRKMKSRRSAVHEYENDDPSAGTYTALELRSRSSDLYDTLTTIHPRPADHQSGSSEYENQSVSVRSSCLLNIINKEENVLTTSQ
ncbi:B-cell receptor CD22-like isoform X2 [Megalobrama amblycephala]|uniref:B-cell receptor CD22-like isoform X2 n=1 Tax=Megalobrama amblycephala TaxID=75352 RepID=UPI00201476E7|nr:B-cell receptor CD22-like isoform X2 [Megalobrama amblycephala]